MDDDSTATRYGNYHFHTILRSLLRERSMSGLDLGFQVLCAFTLYRGSVYPSPIVYYSCAREVSNDELGSNVEGTAYGGHLGFLINY